MDKQSDEKKYEEEEEIFNANPEIIPKYPGGKYNEDHHVSSLLKVLEQVILINKICIGAFVFIVSLLIVLLFFQAKPLNNDSYNQNIEYFIYENKKEL